MRIRPRTTSARPRVSVVMPNYNYAEYVGAAIESALNQRDVDVDITVVDDGSTDNSVDIIERYVAADSRVRLFRHTRNLGFIKTYNEALDAATAPYVAKLDSDDLLSPGSLARSTALMETHPELSFVYGFPQVFRDDSQLVLADEPTQSWTVWSGQRWLQTRFLRGDSPIACPEGLSRREALLRAGGHSDEIPAASDFHLWLRLALEGGVGRVNGPYQGHYRIHEGSLQRTIHAGELDSLNARLTSFELLLRDHGDRIENAATWRKRMHRTLAHDALRWAGMRIDAGRNDKVVDGMVDFALRLDDGPMIQARAAALRSRRALAGGRMEKLAEYVPGRIARDIQGRVRWRLWRRYGL